MGQEPMKNHLLMTQDLTVRFGGINALSKLNFTLRVGELLGLIGPNGSGKTTCFNSLTGINRVDSGKIYLQGRDITGFTPQQIFKGGITRTFQRLRLAVDLSVFDNLIIGDTDGLHKGIYFNLFQRNNLKKEIKEKVYKTTDLLKIFNPHLVAHLYEPVRKLTMIDRRRIEVCRALISSPKVLLLDEPTAGMTEEETRDFMKDLLEIKTRNPDLGIVLIEHEMSVIEKVTDRCLALNYGEKICEGKYEHVMSHKGVRAAYLGDDRFD